MNIYGSAYDLALPSLVRKLICEGKNIRCCKDTELYAKSEKLSNPLMVKPLKVFLAHREFITFQAFNRVRCCCFKRLMWANNRKKNIISAYKLHGTRLLHPPALHIKKFITTIGPKLIIHDEKSYPLFLWNLHYSLGCTFVRLQ